MDSRINKHKLRLDTKGRIYMVREERVDRASVRLGERYRAMKECFPPRLRSELSEVERGVYMMPRGVSEVRIKRHGLSSIIILGVEYPLFYRASGEEMDGIVSRIVGGAMYAHRETVAVGYISYSGMRVGVSGVARYDGESISVGEISSLVFRVGYAECSFASELYRYWQAMGMPNLLIAAPPSGGKTTALRSLAELIGGGKNRMRVALIDERGEFYPEDYRDLSVDVLSRYRRAAGIELAYRTMNAEVIMADEIGDEGDARAILGAHGVGCSLIATVHADSAENAMGRECLAALIKRRVFRHGVLITRENGIYGFTPFEL